MEYERFAAALAGDYELFAAAMTGRYLSVVSAAGTPVPPHLISDFVGMARGLVTRFIVGADNRIDHYASNVASGADVSVRVEDLKQSLRVIVLRNSRDLTQRLRGADGGMKTLLNRPAGAVGLLLQAQLAKPQLKSADSAGRQWDSAKLVRFLARDFAYQSWIDAQANNIENKQGYDLAEVVYADTTRAEHGTLVSLSGEDLDFPAFVALRGQIFHPNSNAQLTAYVPT